jgi:hypothetical protein
MRKILIAAMLVAAFVVPASAQERHRIRAGTVTAIDDAGKTFSCHWRTADWTYRTADKTVFLLGKKTGSFSDLKVGAAVKVNYHVVGKEWIADTVVISAN